MCKQYYTPKQAMAVEMYACAKNLAPFTAELYRGFCQRYRSQVEKTA